MKAVPQKSYKIGKHSFFPSQFSRRYFTLSVRKNLKSQLPKHPGLFSKDICHKFSHSDMCTNLLRYGASQNLSLQKSIMDLCKAMSNGTMFKGGIKLVFSLIRQAQATKDRSKAQRLISNAINKINNILGNLFWGKSEINRSIGRGFDPNVKKKGQKYQLTPITKATMKVIKKTTGQGRIYCSPPKINNCKRRLFDTSSDLKPVPLDKLTPDSKETFREFCKHTNAK